MPTLTDNEYQSLRDMIEAAEAQRDELAAEVKAGYAANRALMDIGEKNGWQIIELTAQLDYANRRIDSLQGALDTINTDNTELRAANATLEKRVKEQSDEIERLRTVINNTIRAFERTAPPGTFHE